MKLFVVVDTKGGGRILGVMDSRERAEQLCDLSPIYYKLHSVTLNQVNPEGLEWTDSDAQKEKLRKFTAGKM